MDTRSDFEEAFRRLGQYLEAVRADEIRLVIVGGAALNRLDFKPLHVGLASRKDLVTLKLFAAADHWPARGVHYSDLVALSPVPDEILSAAEWAKTQDAGPEFPRLIDAVVAGVMEDVHD